MKNEMVIRESVSTCKNLNKVIMSRLAGAKYFSNLDAKSGFFAYAAEHWDVRI